MMIRIGVALLVLFVLQACSGSPYARQAKRYAEDVLCPEERPQVCTMEYAPVCALLDNGRRQEFASACNACSQRACQIV